MGTTRLAAGGQHLQQASLECGGKEATASHWTLREMMMQMSFCAPVRSQNMTCIRHLMQTPSKCFWGEISHNVKQLLEPTEPLFR
jgi:hypothetical protein